jgi:hypothetical protein
MLLSVCYVAVVAAGDVRYVVHISERVSSDVVLLPRYVRDVVHISERVSSDVVLLPRYISDIRHVPVGVALDVYLVLGSRAILILHSVLLSHYGVPINVHKTI